MPQSAVHFCLFTSFFGFISSGPITRAGSFLPQLQAPRRFDADKAVSGLVLMAQGLLAKVCVADLLAVIANGVWGDVRVYSGPVLDVYKRQVHLRFFAYLAHLFLFAQLHHAVRDGKVLHGAHHGDGIAVCPVILVEVPEIGVDEDIAVCEEKRLRHAALQKAQAPAGTPSLVLIGVFQGVLLF